MAKHAMQSMGLYM